MAGVTAIQGVDDTLKKLTTDAIAGLTEKPEVTIGPLDRDSDALRLNWFLYRMSPNPAYRNMEPPRNGWRSSRGLPPLALQLQYLLTAFPSSESNAGDQEQFAHAALAAAMQALHANAIVHEADPALSPLAKPLVEPLRITLDSLDLESISKLWTATTQPLRLSVGYMVSLVIVDALEQHVAGPPVRLRRVALAPTTGPRLRAVDPQRASFGEDVLAAVEGLAAGAAWTLARSDDDPAGPPEGWAMTLVPTPPPPPGTVRLRLPHADLAPGTRRLDVTVTEAGLLVGRDSIGVTVVPIVTGPTTALAKGTPVDLETAHAAADVEVFLAGTRLAPASVTFVSPTKVTITIPPATPAGSTEVALRAGKLAGPTTLVEVAP
jgi:Pvc16 N-terminal domain